MLKDFEQLKGFLKTTEGSLAEVCKGSMSLNDGDCFLCFIHKGSMNFESYKDGGKIQVRYEVNALGEVTRIDEETAIKETAL